MSVSYTIGVHIAKIDDLVLRRCRFHSVGYNPKQRSCFSFDELGYLLTLNLLHRRQVDVEQRFFMVATRVHFSAKRMHGFQKTAPKDGPSSLRLVV
jgi:hypothetical protein